MKYDHQKSVEGFNRAIKLSPEERTAFIHSFCQGDEVLLSELLKMIKSFEHQPSQFIDQIIDSSNLSTREGERIGNYQLKEMIGHGGMADVYKALRTDGVHNSPVALKVIRNFQSDRSLIQRFQTERIIAATLKHPNIAQIFDGGNTEDGLPYYVMEYIDGTTIEKYCLTNKLDIRQKLTLFSAVCDAVFYAHQHLIIHRDIKPSNILVTQEGKPKLLDFGIAKILSPKDVTDVDAQSNNSTTVLGVFPMTPSYASPEQVEGRTLTTASDIYSLGVLLFELLTSRVPYKGRSQFDILREISEKDTPLMSRSVPDDNKELRRILSGDLDSIVAKAMAKDPERRYLSVLELVDDINRFLNDMPVLARKGARWYRSHRFIRRNSRTISLLAAAAVIIVGVGVTQQIRVTKERDIAQFERLQAEQERDIATAERDKFKQTQEFMIGLFELSNPDTARGSTITAKQILDSGVEKIDLQLVSQPEVKSELLHTMGVVYQKLGLYDESLSLLQRTLSLRRQSFREDSLEVAESLNELGILWDYLGKYEPAQHAYSEALPIYQSKLGERSIQVANLHHNLGHVHWRKANYDLAISHYNQSLSLKVELLDGKHPGVGETYTGLGLVYWNKGEYKKAIEYYLKALPIYKDSLGDDFPMVGRIYNNLGLIHWSYGEYPKSLEYYNKAIEFRLKVFGNLHPRVADSYHGIALVYNDIGQYDKAIEYHNKAISIVKQILTRDHPIIGDSYNGLGLVYLEKGEFNTAINYFEKALAIRIHAVDLEHPRIAYIYNNLGRSYFGLERYNEAADYFNKSLKIKLLALGEQHVSTAATYINIGKLKFNAGLLEDANRLFAEALDIMRRLELEDHPLAATSYQWLAKTYTESDPVLATTYFQRAYDIRLTKLGPDHRYTKESARLLLGE